MLTVLARATRRVATTIAAHGRRSEGQSTVFLVAFLFLFFAFGAIVVDVGLMLNERREAQSDADRAALAGVMELSLSADPSVAAADESAAIVHSIAWAGKNGVPNDSSLTVAPVRDCFSGTGNDDGRATGMQVTVEREPASFFLNAFGITNWTVSATSVACSAGRDIAIVIDRSGSMCHDTHPQAGANCPSSPTAWEPFNSVQAASLGFAANFSPVYDQLALISYATTATTNQPLGTAFGPGSAFETAVRSMQPDGNTNIGDAIALGRAQLVGPAAQPTAARIMVLLTDGIPNQPFNSSYARTHALNQAQLAASDGVLIYVIGLGDNLDGNFLQDVASIGNGVYLNAPEASDLQAAFQTIADLAHARLVQ